MSVGRTSLVILYIRKQYQNIFKKQYPRHPYIPFHDLFFPKHFLPSDITCITSASASSSERKLPENMYFALTADTCLVTIGGSLEICDWHPKVNSSVPATHIFLMFTICRIIIKMSYIRCLIHVTVLMFISEHSVLIFISSWFPRPVTSTLKFVF